MARKIWRPIQRFEDDSKVTKRFEIHDVPGDGNCLFAALSVCLFKTTDRHAEVRKKCVEHVLANWDEMCNWTHAPNGDPYTKDDYEKAMATLGTWGGASEVRAASAVFSKRVVVLENYFPAVSFGQPADDPVHLVYTHHQGRGGHYKAAFLVPDEVEQEPTPPTTPPNVPSQPNNSSSGSSCHELDPTNVPRGQPPCDENSNSPGTYRLYQFAPGTRTHHATQPKYGIRNEADGRRISAFRPSLALPAGRQGSHYRWAANYDGEEKDPVMPVDVGQCEHECEDCGALFWGAERLNRNNHTPAVCCGSQEKVALPPEGVFRPISDENVRELYFGSSQQAADFQKNIRGYNTILSVAHSQADYKRVTGSRCKSVIVNGKVVFRADAFPNLSEDGKEKTCGQLYMVDMTDETIERRLAASTLENLDPDIVRLLESYLRANNDLIRTFKFAGEIQKEAEEMGLLDDNGEVSRIALIVNPKRKGLQLPFRSTERQLWSDEPTQGIRPANSDFVAGVYSGMNPEYNYDMIFFPRNRPEGDAPYWKVHVTAPTLDVMLYPLIHLHAEASWLNTTQLGPKKRRRRGDADDEINNDDFATAPGETSLRKYYSYRLQIRRNDSGVLLKSRSLFLQWLIDAAVKIVDNNLQFAKNNQDILEVCKYVTLQRFVQDQAQRRNKQPGKIVVIPKGEWKSERRITIEYLDAVRISMEFGAPTLFITFTTNPNWIEIEEELKSCGMKKEDWIYRPDITMRVFLLKRHMLLSYLVNNAVLGRCLAYVVVDEFQKSGLAHSHIALILHPADIPAMPDEIDRVISAEIPSPEEDPELHELVMTFMLHKPCDGTCSKNPYPSCKKSSTGKCKSSFPFAKRDFTLQTRKGILYRRRAGPKYWHRGFGCFVDNSWTIPHCIKLLKAFKCHLNVLRCADAILFKYLYSYMDKMKHGDTVSTSMYKYSLDRATGDVLDWDEIEHYVAMRYMSPYEAVYRIFGVSFGKQSHTVHTLHFHLPNEQLVYWHGASHAGTRVAANREEKSKLLEWFNLNAHSSPEERSLRLYASIMKTHRWEQGQWVPRDRPQPNLGRLMNVNPSPRNMELFYLRLLLLSVGGATRYEDFRTVNGKEYETFREACCALGLETGGETFVEAMEEVAAFASPKQLRTWFATILAKCNACNGQELWEAHQGSMCEDYIEQGHPQHLALRMARKTITDMVSEMGLTTMENLEIDDNEADGTDLPMHDHDQEMSVITMSNSGDLPYQFNEGQRHVYETVIHRLETGIGPSLLTVSGAAGTGKTYVYKAIMEKAGNMGKKCLAASFTALAAQLLNSGMTCHRAFGIPIRAKMDGTDRTFLERCSEQGQLLINCDLIIIDEMSMLAAWHMDLIDECLKMMMENQTIMGGKLVILGGDMRQVLPIFKGLSIEQVVRNVLTSSKVWKQCKHMHLTENMRAQEDPIYANWVDKVGSGTANIRGTASVHIPDKYLVSLQDEEYETLRDKLIGQVFGEFTEEEIVNGTVLAPTHDVVDDINETIVQRMQASEERTFVCRTQLIRDEIEDADEAYRFPIVQEELDNISAGNLPPQSLHVKIASVVMLVTNISQAMGLCNGTRCIVRGFGDHHIQVQKLKATGDADIFFLPRLLLQSDDVPVHGAISRRQFPVKIGHAITINKSQGQTIEKAGLMLKRPVFSHGQLYVALSRVRCGKNMKIAIVSGPEQTVRGRAYGKRKPESANTRNIVYKEILESLP